MSALSTSFALPLIATPSIAAIASNDCSYPELAARFHDFYARWRALYNPDVAKSAEIEQRMFERTGVKLHDSHLLDNYWDVRIAVLQTFPADAPDYTERWDEILDESNKLVRLILAQRPVTRADLILQARACAMLNSDMWLDQATVGSLERSEQSFRSLVENLINLDGEELFPGVVVFQPETESISADLDTDHDNIAADEPSLVPRKNADDPIFAAIVAHAAANETFLKIHSSVPHEPGEEFDAWELRMDDAYDAEVSARSDLYACAPTTPAGVQTMLSYLGALTESEKDEWLIDIDDARSLFSSLQNAVQSLFMAETS